MLIRHLDGHRWRDLQVSITDPDATVADLATALEPDRPAGPLLVDGRLVAAATPLDRAAILHGARVHRPPDPGLPPPPARSAGAVVAVVTTGPDAGRSVLLAPGSHPIGRATGPGRSVVGAPPHPAVGLALQDPTVSAHHATLDVGPGGAVTVRDHGSTNGTWLGDRPIRSAVAIEPGTEVRCGATRFELGPAPAPPPSGAAPPLAGTARTRPLHRRPRPAPAPRRRPSWSRSTRVRPRR